MEGIENNSVVGQAQPVGNRVREARDEVSRLRTQASRVVENSMSAARRLSKRGRDVTEDWMEVATDRIQKDPLRSVATGLAVGFGVGALAVWLATRTARQ